MPLTPDRWRELSPYLDEAFDLDIARRPEWLARIQARDPDLAADLQLLLAEQQTIHESGFLEQAKTSISPGRQADERPGKTRC